MTQMNPTYYLAIDIGASGGRHLLAWREGTRIAMEEVFRFSNHAIPRQGRIVWDTRFLFDQILEGLKRCAEIGKIPSGIGIDTFGVDYALLDGEGRLQGEVTAYRDPRTVPAKAAFARIISEAEQYQRTGIQPQVFNTIYQLMAEKGEGGLDRGERILFLPCYLTFLLTGVAANEYTIASTSGLLEAGTRTWDTALLDVLGLKPERFPPLVMPGTRIGTLMREVREAVGFDAMVFATSAHDTASAVLGSLVDPETAYLSSGTWSLLGTLTDRPILDERARKWGFTNEGNYQGKIRFLKNIMGLWMIQEIRSEQDSLLSYPDISGMASSHADFSGIVDVNDPSFLAPKSMSQAVKDFLLLTGQKVPVCLGEMYYCVFHSLAVEYAKTLSQLETLTGRTFQAVNIVGGGSKNRLLNELTGSLTGKKILTGPTEATALGNVIVQMLATGEISDFAELRTLVEETIRSEK